jgi:hypothetical protein
MSKATKSAQGGNERTRARLATAFGWIAGGALGLLANWGIYALVGPSYPTTYTTFGFFLVGAFGGMALADRLGPRGFRPLAIAAGVLFAVFVAIAISALMASSS